MHVGHLRSTVIGDALARMYRFAGHDVIARNHVGDWGTPFAMLIEHLLDLGEDQAIATLSIGDLDALLQGGAHQVRADDAFKGRSRARVVALQGGDPETLRLWHVLVNESIAYFSEVYQDSTSPSRRTTWSASPTTTSMLEDVVPTSTPRDCSSRAAARCASFRRVSQSRRRAVAAHRPKERRGIRLRGDATSRRCAIASTPPRATRCSTSSAPRRPSTSRWSSPSRAWPDGCPIACAVSTWSLATCSVPTTRCSSRARRDRQARVTDRRGGRARLRHPR